VTRRTQSFSLPLVVESSVRVHDGVLIAALRPNRCGRVVVVVVGVGRDGVGRDGGGIMELCDSENSVFLTASGGRVVRPCP
jgi:hypothetical protein